MSSDPIRGLDEEEFQLHLKKGPFQNGVDRNRWRLISVEWPYVVLAVRAAPRSNSPDEYFFRFECNNYPTTPPTAQPWNQEKNSPLEPGDWPGGTGRLPFAFNPGWKSGSCLYLPCDRLSIEGHEPWRTQHPSMIWSSTGDITQYLRIIYDLLNSESYTGTRSTLPPS